MRRGPSVEPDDFDRDASDRRLIGWVGVALVVASVLYILVRAARLWR